MIIKIVLSIAIGYLIGSAVAAIMVSKLFFKEDVRDKGSGNSGATNAARVYGLGFGVLTFVIDFAKGVLACWLGSLIAGRAGMAFAGLACMIGHCWPVYFGFRGGKGVSVGAAFALMADWRVFAIGIGVFIVIVLLTKRVSPGSVLGAFAVGVTCVIFPPELAFKIIGPIAALLVIIKHCENIKRILNGTEPAFSPGRKTGGGVKG